MANFYPTVNADVAAPAGPTAEMSTLPGLKHWWTLSPRAHGGQVAPCQPRFGTGDLVANTHHASSTLPEPVTSYPKYTPYALRFNATTFDHLVCDAPQLETGLFSVWVAFKLTDAYNAVTVVNATGEHEMMFRVQSGNNQWMSAEIHSNQNSAPARSIDIKNTGPVVKGDAYWAAFCYDAANNQVTGQSSVSAAVTAALATAFDTEWGSGLSDQLIVGGSRVGNYFFDGQIAEAAFFDGNIFTTDRDPADPAAGKLIDWLTQYGAEYA